MTETFVDSFYWLAVLNPHDTHHAMAVRLRPPQRMVTTRAVQVEVMDAFSAPPLRAVAGQFWSLTNDDPALVVVGVDDDLLARAVDFFVRHRDKAWSLTDCISFVVMCDRNITDVLSGDHHFEQAGFHVLLGPGKPSRRRSPR